MVANEGSTFFIKTNLEAPRYRCDGCEWRVTGVMGGFARGATRGVCRTELRDTRMSLPTRVWHAHRMVKVADVAAAGPPASWTDHVPQHDKDVLQVGGVTVDRWASMFEACLL